MGKISDILLNENTIIDDSWLSSAALNLNNTIRHYLINQSTIFDKHTESDYKHPETDELIKYDAVSTFKIGATRYRVKKWYFCRYNNNNNNSNNILCNTISVYDDRGHLYNHLLHQHRSNYVIFVLGL